MQDVVTPPAALLCAQREGHTPATERALPCRKNEICAPAAKTFQTPVLRTRATPRAELSCRALRRNSPPRDVCDAAAEKTILCVWRTKRRTRQSHACRNGALRAKTKAKRKGAETTRRAKSCAKRLCSALPALQSSHRGVRQQRQVPNLAEIRLLDFWRRRRKLRENACPQSCCLH